MTHSRTLYIGEKNISSWSMRGFLALEHKQLPYEEKTISLRADKSRAERRKVSPTGKVPVLHDGGLVIPDSMAIIEYLEETYPPPGHPALWPAKKEDRAEARWLAATMHSGFADLRDSMSFNLCFLPQPPAATPKALEEASEMLSFWERALEKKTLQGPFLFGAFGAVDIMYAVAVVRLTAFRVPTDRTPKAAEYMTAILAQPYVKKWMDAARALPPQETY
jgi:glutathione S-transferase